MRRNLALAVLIAALRPPSPLAGARTLRWSSRATTSRPTDGGRTSCSPTSINGHVYREACSSAARSSKILPALATGLEADRPTKWVFTLRKGGQVARRLRLHRRRRGFLHQAQPGPTSNFRVYGNAVGEPRKVDDHTVEFTTPVPNPVMLQMLTNSLFVMNKAWCEKHKAERAQDFTNKEETYTSRNAMGTGPFMLVSREADVKTVLRKNPNWWGLKEKGYFTGNVEEIVYSPVKSEGTRMAALLAGNLDLVLDPPVQDVES